ncbi:MAG: glycosyltransferase family 2 protein [Bacteroidetes bacterium]|nr:glycosyltransferase family 2 protein [Bacteroidota bacterium]
MSESTPLVTVIMATYNRAGTIERAVESVLNQTYTNLELLIIDDGSMDNTLQILRKYTDSRIRIIKHEHNQGVTAAKNTGLRNLKGEWFTTFDSDDEMMPAAIETMLAVTHTVNPGISVVQCNTFNHASQSLSGTGLEKDGYIDSDIIASKCKGDFWGLLKSSLLNGNLFNEYLSGYESTLWFKLYSKATIFYIHKPLSIIYTEGSDRVSVKKFNLEREIRHYKNLIIETTYLEVIKKNKPWEFNVISRNGVLLMLASGNKPIAMQYYEMLNNSDRKLLIKTAMQIPMLARLYVYYRKFKTLR